jgi:hypothetical protein
MDSKVQLAAKLQGRSLDTRRTRMEARLKKLRRELRLIQRAITALAELAKARQSRARPEFR